MLGKLAFDGFANVEARETMAGSRRMKVFWLQNRGGPEGNRGLNEAITFATISSPGRTMIQVGQRGVRLLERRPAASFRGP
jgi:hypothetical protein